MLVKLLGYAPDADPSILGVLTNCSAVVPSLRGMRGAPSPASTPLATLAATCQGSAVLTKLDGSTRFFAATAKKIYEAAASTWGDVSRAATYTAGVAARYRFAQFGNISLSANGADTLQASTSTGPFSCVAGAPIAAITETVGQFAFAFNNTTNADGWNCSALGDSAQWTTSVATQATSGRLTASPGPITGGRRFGSAIVAYKKNSMYLGLNVGPPNVWEFNQIPGDVGAMSQEAVVNVGTPDSPRHIFMGSYDFYMYDGSKAIPIGSNRVKNQVFTTLLQSRYSACAAVHDSLNSLVYFYYPVSDSQLPDHCVVYNYRTDQWGVDDRQIQVPVEYATPGITYNTLGDRYLTYDQITTLPYDSAFLNQAITVPSIFTTGSIVNTLTGPAGTTSITTGDIGDDVQFSTLKRARLRFITAPTTASMTNSYRDPGNTLVADASVAMSSQNAFDVMRDAKWHRLSFTFSGDWEASAFIPELEASGFE